MFDWDDPIKRKYNSLFPFMRDIYSLPSIRMPSVSYPDSRSFFEYLSAQSILQPLNPVTPDEIAAAEEFRRRSPEEKIYSLLQNSPDVFPKIPRDLMTLLFDEIANADDLSFKKYFEESPPEVKERILQLFLSELMDR